MEQEAQEKDVSCEMTIKENKMQEKSRSRRERGGKARISLRVALVAEAEDAPELRRPFSLCLFDLLSQSLSTPPSISDMEALRGISGTLLPRSKPHAASLSQLLFLRTFTSKIFVKGLALSTTAEKLAEAFSQFGSVLKADVVMNKAKNRSKGFGYVTFAKEEEARKAQMAMNRKILHGRVLYVDMEPPRRRNISSFDE